MADEGESSVWSFGWPTKIAAFFRPDREEKMLKPAGVLLYRWVETFLWWFGFFTRPEMGDRMREKIAGERTERLRDCATVWTRPSYTSAAEGFEPLDRGWTNHAAVIGLICKLIENYVETLEKKTFYGYQPGGLGFDRKWRFWPETAWNSFFTLVDMVWPVLSRWTRFWPETVWNSFFFLVDMVWPVLTRWTRFWSKTAWNSFFTLVDMVGPVLTQWNRFLWKDAVESRKVFFWILNFFLIFLDFYK